MDSYGSWTSTAIGNITISANSIISTNTNGNINLTPNGTGAVVIDTPKSANSTEIWYDINGNEIWAGVTTTDAVTYISFIPGATGVAAVIKGLGETNCGLDLIGQGSGPIRLGHATSAGVDFLADQPIRDSSGNELVKWTKVGSAVNELTIGNNSTGLGPTLTASGETNLPITLAGKGTGPVNIGQTSSTGVKFLADQPILDSAGLALIKFTKVGTAVTWLNISNNSTGVGPVLLGEGETNTDLTIKGTGSGKLKLGQASTGGIQLEADQPILDSAGNEYLKFVKTSSAVNEFTIKNSATTVAPIISATGGDTHIGLQLTPKGTASVVSTGIFLKKVNVVTDTTAGVYTYTAAGMFGGLFLRNPNGASRADLSPAASVLVTAAGPGVAVNSGFRFTIRNTATAAETITFSTASGITLSGTMTIAQNTSRSFLGVFTNVTGASEAVTIYDEGATSL